MGTSAGPAEVITTAWCLNLGGNATDSRQA
jgi:hypothetical protein